MPTKHDKSRPTISVIVPVFNGERYLAEALNSILAQTYRNFEVMLIDDGSTDSTAKVARQFSKDVHYHTQSNKGPSAARNKAITLSSGKYLAFFDADDLMENVRLEKQLHAFDKLPNLDIVFGHISEFISPDIKEYQGSINHWPRTSVPGRCVGTMLIRRDSFEKVGYFDEQLKVADFMDWYGQAQDLGLKIKMLPDVILQRRLHNSNYSIQEQEKRKDEYAKVLKSVLERRRKKDK